MNERMLIFAGRSNPPLAHEIATALGQPLGKVVTKNFDDGETHVQYQENIRGAEVFIIQSTNQPDSNLMELLIMIDTAKRASARKVNAVIPYFGYARQDRKAQGREPITAKLNANLITTAGADRVITMDLPAPQIQGFFDIPVDHLYGYLVFEDILKTIDSSRLAVATCDVGGIKLARAYAKRLSTKDHEVPLIVIDKRRSKHNNSEVMKVIGEVNGYEVLIVDDLIDTAGTICNAADALDREGAVSTKVVATHLVLSNKAIVRIQASKLEVVYGANTIFHPIQYDKIQPLSAAQVFGQAIKRVFQNESISTLFPEVS